MAGLAATLSPLAVGTAVATEAAIMSCTKAFVKDGVMVGRDTMTASLSSRTVVVTADMSVASSTDTLAETVAVLL